MANRENSKTGLNRTSTGKTSVHVALSVVLGSTLMMPAMPLTALATDDTSKATAERARIALYAETGASNGEDSSEAASKSETGEPSDESSSDGSTANPSASPSPSPMPSSSNPPALGDDAASSTAEEADQDEEEGDRSADVETAGEWQAMADALEFTGQWSHDLLLMAESQLGYNESEENFIYEDEDKEKKQGYTRYGDWYGDGDSVVYGEWCAMFVSFCLHYAGVEGTLYGANCASWVSRLQQADAEDAAAAEQADIPFDAATNRYQSAQDYIPQPGDIVFFDKGTGTACHVGIVKCLNYDESDNAHPVSFTTIEGNNGPVGYHEYGLGGVDGVLGFMRLPENPDYRTVQCGATALCVTAEIPQNVSFDARLVDYRSVGEYDSEEMGEGENADGAQVAVPDGWEVIAAVTVSATADGESWEPPRPAVASFVRTGTMRTRAAAFATEDGSLEIIAQEHENSTISFGYRGAGMYVLLAQKDAGIAEQVRIANEQKASLATSSEDGSSKSPLVDVVRVSHARALSFEERVEAAKPSFDLPETAWEEALGELRTLK